MPTTTNEFFKFLIIIQLLFGFFLTGASYFLPAAAENQLENFGALWTQQSATEVEEGMGDIKDDMRDLDLGLGSMFVVFNTGFFILDLLLNSLLAIPQMVTIAVNGLFLLAPINPWTQAVVTSVIFAIVSIVYWWMLLTFLFSALSGRVV